jgi:hypothetical protein
MTHKRGPITLDNCNGFEHQLFDEKWPMKKFINSNLTNWVSVFMHLFFFSMFECCNSLQLSYFYYKHIFSFLNCLISRFMPFIL